ncbi:MAG: T9SS type A sorting domain-containing protein [Candidatus Cloacimonetes bacterium]|nr:T9SS type A sorting domain-containing protein [Candidatus Cloacimonadota bacterium]
MKIKLIIVIALLSHISGAMASWQWARSYGHQGLTDIVLIADTHTINPYVFAGGSGFDDPTDVEFLSDGRIAVGGWHTGLSRFGSHLIDSGSDVITNGFVALYAPSTAIPPGTAVPAPSPITCSPNPFSSQTTIRVSKPTPGNPQISIYNLRGQIVRTLPGFTRSAHHYEFGFDGLDNNGKPCPAGIYFIRVTGTGLDETRKVILIRN